MPQYRHENGDVVTVPAVLTNRYDALPGWSRVPTEKAAPVTPPATEATPATPEKENKK